MANEPIQFAKVSNPTNEDLDFSYNSAKYVLKAGSTEDKWSPHMAKHAAKKLADKNVMTTDPQEHRVLMGAYLSNQEVDVIAERLGINLVQIRKEAMTKKQKEARVINLEATMLEMREELKALKEKNASKVEASKSVKKVTKRSKSKK